MANRDRVKLAFIHVPDEGSGAVGGRQVQGLGRVRGWMTPGQAGWHWHWQVVCRWVCLADRQAGRQALDWTGRPDWRQRSLAGWLASSGGDKQAAAAQQRQRGQRALFSRQSPNGAA